MKNRKNILTIAGFDPSGGAGVLADVKTIEQNKLQSFAVITANTVQTEDSFESVNWVDEDLVMTQLGKIIDKYPIQGVKIGLVPNGEFLERAIRCVLEIQGTAHFEKPLIVWDPVLATSTGFSFQQGFKNLHSVLKLVDYITPNQDEIRFLTGKDALDGARELSQYTNVYLKGGHSEDLGTDYLVKENQVFPFKPRVIGTEKHGSGCIQSSALLANLVLGNPEVKACLKAKRYIEQKLSSNKTLLTYHKP
ncbi:MAG: hydroxymethylpyrimidine/phosphomethylpyrimidine kinase [Parvicellaceae bacterium]